ncbi:TPA: DUF4054 domain-containing protein [Escherichia coli]|jgi:hypothetical protein|nr:DUF4054 domain-containing protein [Escherichia coli]
MVTLPDLIARFPAMADVPQATFDIYLKDTQKIMGVDEHRWISWYDQAQACLLAHLITFNGALSADGDAGMTAGPVTRTDVDDVQVEFAEKIWNKLPYQEADLYSTGYGQQYVRWRRMAFAGPRVVPGFEL